VVDTLTTYLEDSRWLEVSLLAVAYIGVVQQRDKAASKIIRRLISASKGEAGAAVTLAGEMVLDAWPDGVTDACRDLVLKALLALTSNSAHVRPQRRALAGQVLAQLGDPRPEVLDVEAMPFCYVPAGAFWLGSADSDNLARKDEQPIQQMRAPFDYWLAQYPATNAQCAQFVLDGGYETAGFWQEAQEMGYWQDGRFRANWDTKFRQAPFNFGKPFNLPNHPAVGITWYEALAFSRWLEARWRARA
jgi:formylglycine-generating enzyme required for sulfatase activity